MTVFTRIFEGVFAFVAAAVLWAVFSLPVVTVVPATVAVFAVMTAWGEHGPPSVWSEFWAAFRKFFKQSMWFTVLLTIVWSIIILDIRYGLRAEGAPLRSVVMVAGIVAMIFLAGTLVYLFPVMVRFPATWRRVLRNAGLFAAAYIFSTLLGLLLFGAAVLVFLGMPVLLPLLVPAVAFVQTRLTGRTFDRYLLTHDVELGESTASDQPAKGS